MKSLLSLIGIIVTGVVAGIHCLVCHNDRVSDIEDSAYPICRTSVTLVEGT